MFATRLTTLLLSLAVLAFATMAKASEDESQCRELASVIDLYLSGKADAAELKAIESAEALAKANARPDDPVRRIFSYLGGSKDVDFRRVAVQCNSRSDLWALASMALFARSLSEGQGVLDQAQIENYLRNYQDAISSGSSSASAQKWRERSDAWLAWCTSSFLVSEGLEPLLRKRSRDPKTEVTASGLDDLTLEAFTKSRIPFEARPRPAGLFFQGPAMERYFSTIDNDKLRDLERQRYEYIKDIKTYLLRIFVRSPYNGKVKLTKNRVLNGTIALANEKFFLVRDSNDKSTKCEWEEALPEQFPDFLSYYAKMRMNISGPNLTEMDKHRQAAEDLAHASVLCDWLGRYQDSLDYAKLSIQLYPAMKTELLKVLLGH